MKASQKLLQNKFKSSSFSTSDLNHSKNSIDSPDRKNSFSKITNLNYHNEKKQINDIRKQILEEMEAKELTFKPRINTKSTEIEKSLLQKNDIIVDPITKTRSYRVKKTTYENSDFNTTDGK